MPHLHHSSPYRMQPPYLTHNPIGNTRSVTITSANKCRNRLLNHQRIQKSINYE
ncbi:hypothetical protein Hanom_Chr00s000004g01606131 [Helianthus anomalus]